MDTYFSLLMIHHWYLINHWMLCDWNPVKKAKNLWQELQPLTLQTSESHSSLFGPAERSSAPVCADWKCMCCSAPLVRRSPLLLPGGGVTTRLQMEHLCWQQPELVPPLRRTCWYEDDKPDGCSHLTLILYSSDRLKQIMNEEDKDSTACCKSKQKNKQTSKQKKHYWFALKVYIFSILI